MMEDHKLKRRKITNLRFLVSYHRNFPRSMKLSPASDPTAAVDYNVRAPLQNTEVSIFLYIRFGQITFDQKFGAPTHELMHEQVESNPKPVTSQEAF